MRRRRARERGQRAPLSAGALTARRTDWYRRRARRRVVLGLVALLGGAGIVALALVGSRGRPGSAPVTHAAVGAPRFIASRPHSLHGLGPYSSVYRVLRYTSYVRLAGSRRREVALSFDDGPGPYTSAIIRILTRTHTPATFFVIGRQVAAYRRLIATEARDGFDVGDHTETHPFLSALPEALQETQIVEAAQAIHGAGAPYPHLFRPPYGSFDAATLSVLRALRMLVVLWSVDTSDYLRPGVAKIVYVALSGLRPGAIILMHDGGGPRAETVQALPEIIRGLRRRGYRAVTVAQLVADDPPAHDQPPPQALSGSG